MHKVAAKRHWRPGRWFISRTEREEYARLLRWTWELVKLLPDGVDQVPRAAIRTVKGAWYLREEPKFGSRAWLDERLVLYERALRPWYRRWLGR